MGKCIRGVARRIRGFWRLRQAAGGVQPGPGEGGDGAEGAGDEADGARAHVLRGDSGGGHGDNHDGIAQGFHGGEDAAADTRSAVWRSSCELLSTLVTAMPTRESSMSRRAAAKDPVRLKSMYAAP